jgi:hypothetical protein
VLASGRLIGRSNLDVGLIGHLTFFSKLRLVVPENMELLVLGSELFG